MTPLDKATHLVALTSAMYEESAKAEWADLDIYTEPALHTEETTPWRTVRTEYGLLNGNTQFILGVDDIGNGPEAHLDALTPTEWQQQNRGTQQDFYKFVIPYQDKTTREVARAVLEAIQATQKLVN